MAAENNKKIDSEIGQALFSDTERFEMWFAAYWKPVTVIAVILTVLTAVVFWVATARSAAERKAAFELADAATETELTAVLKKYPDHAGSAVARFRLAKLFLEAKKYQDALKELDAVANAAGADATLAAQAKMAAGYACELSGNIKDAIPRFLAVESAAALPAALRAEAGYCAGRLLLKSGNTKQAKAVLNRTVLLGNTPAVVGYWTDNAKQTLIAIDNGEYRKPAPAKKPAAVKPAPAKKPAAVKPAPAKKPAAVKTAPVQKTAPAK